MKKFLDSKTYFTNDFNDTPFKVKNTDNLFYNSDNPLGDLSIEGPSRIGKLQINTIPFGFYFELFYGESNMLIQCSPGQHYDVVITAILTKVDFYQVSASIVVPFAQQDKGLAEVMNRVYFAAYRYDMPGVNYLTAT